MKAKYTEGPWECELNSEPGRVGFVPTSHGKRIADAAWHQEAEANAALIAAAPEMAEALLQARSMLETASRYFPKSIKNADRFALLNLLANTINPALVKAGVVE